MTRADFTDQIFYDQKPCMWRVIWWNIAEIQSAFTGTGMNLSLSLHRAFCSLFNYTHQHMHIHSFNDLKFTLKRLKRSYMF